MRVKALEIKGFIALLIKKAKFQFLINQALTCAICLIAHIGKTLGLTGMAALSV
jgi:hypothetical protein